MIPQQGIATDASHSVKNQVTRFRGVDLKTGKEIFYHEIGNQTVNIGEFLGVVSGLKYIMENNYTPAILYTDSLTAISWLKNKKATSAKKNTEVAKAEIFLRLFSFEIDKIKVFHWSNKTWGEIPADFGLK